MGKIVDQFVSSELDKYPGERRLCKGCSLWGSERRKTVRAKAPCNNVSVQLPRSCKVCILKKHCGNEYATEQCWRNAVTAHFA